MENTFLQVHQKKVLESQRYLSCLFEPVPVSTTRRRCVNASEKRITERKEQ